MTKPTGRPSGRHRGSKNKATIEREERARIELEAREREMQDGVEVIASARRSGRKLGRDVLDDLMHLGMGLTAEYQRLASLAPGQQIGQGTAAMEEKFWQAAAFTKDCAVALTNYQSPKLKASVVMHGPREEVPLLPTPAPGSTNVKYFLEHTYRRMLKTVG